MTDGFDRRDVLRGMAAIGAAVPLGSLLDATTTAAAAPAGATGTTTAAGSAAAAAPPEVRLAWLEGRPAETATAAPGACRGRRARSRPTRPSR